MKRLFFLCAAMLCLAGMKAVNYDLKVAGVQVTDANKADILGDGTVYYNPNSNFLVIKNATINSSVEGIYNGINRLRILCGGKSTITTTGSNYSGIYATNSTYIEGLGDSCTLTINANNTGGIGVAHFGQYVCFGNDNSECQLHININAKRYGILGTMGSAVPASTTSAFVCDNVMLTISAVEEACVAGEASFTHDLHVHYISPADAVFNQSTYRVENANGGALKQGLIIGDDSERYDLYVCGVQVTEKNYNKVRKGVSYDPFNHVLTLDNVNIENATPVIHSKLEALKIKVVGSCLLNCTNSTHVLLCTGPTEIFSGCDSATLTMLGVDKGIIHEDMLWIHGSHQQVLKVIIAAAENAIAGPKDRENYLAATAIDTAYVTLISGLRNPAVVNQIDFVTRGVIAVDPAEDVALNMDGALVNKSTKDVLNTAIFIKEPAPANALSSVEADVKAVKQIENGQLVIIRNGVRYNAVGTVIR